jgi:hypothetical protein
MTGVLFFTAASLLCGLVWSPAALLALSPLLLRESRAALTRRSYDPAGALTSTGGLVLLVYALVAGSGVLLAALALIESRHRAPLRFLGSRTLVGALTAGVPFVLTLYAQQVLGYSAVRFGIGSVVLAVGATVTWQSTKVRTRWWC